MSDSVRPHRRQPTRLPRPWDSLGKNTGVGCHSLLQCRKVKSESEVAQSCLTPSDPMHHKPTRGAIRGIELLSTSKSDAQKSSHISFPHFLLLASLWTPSPVNSSSFMSPSSVSSGPSQAAMLYFGFLITWPTHWE